MSEKTADDDFICVRCGRRGRTCCQRSHVFLSRGDVERVSSAAPGELFHEYSSPADPDFLPDPAADPVWARTFGPGGRRRALAHKPGGDCCFLEATGCRLALEVRPLVCRLYPFDYNHVCIKGVDAHLCPEPESESPALILAALAMDRAAAEGWRRDLYREITEEFPEDASPEA